MSIKAKSYFNLLLVVIFWGMTFPIQKSILAGLSPVFYNAFRFTIATLLVLIFRKFFMKSFSRKALKRGIILGIVLGSAYVFQTWGLSITSASKNSFITALYVGIVAVLSPVIEKKYPKPVQIISLGVSLVGLYLLTSPNGGGFNLGDFLSLLCAIAFAMHVILISVFTQEPDIDELSLLFPQLLLVTVINFALIPFVPGRIFMNAGIISVAVFAAIFATIFAVTVQLKYQKHIGSIGSALIYVAEPAFALLFSMLILTEIPTGMEILGLSVMTTGMIIAGIYSVSVKDEKEE